MGKLLQEVLVSDQAKDLSARSTDEIRAVLPERL